MKFTNRCDSKKNVMEGGCKNEHSTKRKAQVLQIKRMLRIYYSQEHDELGSGLLVRPYRRHDPSLQAVRV